MCYRNSLLLALAHELASIAFPAISTGAYGFPPDRAARIAVAAVLEDLHAEQSVARAWCSAASAGPLAFTTSLGG